MLMLVSRICSTKRSGSDGGSSAPLDGSELIEGGGASRDETSDEYVKRIVLSNVMSD